MPRRPRYGSDTGSGEDLKHAFARCRSGYPGDRLVWLGEPVEGQRKSRGSEYERQRQPQLVVRVIGDIEADDERAVHRSFDVDM